MESPPPCTELHLEHNRPIRLENAAGATVVCRSGILWITCDGNSEDVFLHAGQRHRIAARGTTLVECIGNGRLDLRKAPCMSARLLANIRQFVTKNGKWTGGAA